MLKFFLYVLTGLLFSLTSLAQDGSAPAVTSRALQPAPLLGNGSAFTLTFRIGNNGATSISGLGAGNANRMQFAICLGGCAPNPVSTAALTGPLLTYFDVTYNTSNNCFEGRQKQNVEIPPASVYSLSVAAVATKASTNTAVNDIGASCTITPNGNSTPQSTDNDFASIYTHTSVCSPVAITAQPRSSTTVPAGSTVTASVSVTGTVSAYQWYKNGNAVSGQTSATLTLSNVQAGDAGSYVVAIVSPCNSVTSTAFALVVNTVPDLTPIIYARPTSLTGPKPVSVVVEVLELNGIATSGLLTLRITRDPSLSLSLPTSATSVGGRTVQNNVWQLNLDDPNYYVLTTNQSIVGGDLLAVGLMGTLSPGGTTGILTVSSVLVNITGETRGGNNTDADKIEYCP